MARAALVSLFIVLLACGCGQTAREEALASGRLTTETTGDDAPPDESTEPIGGSGGLIFGYAVGEAPERPDIQKLYAVFTRSPDRDDERAVAHARSWFDGVPAGEDKLGPVIASEARVLLDGLGGDEDMVYAVPTANGYVCVGLAPSGASSCGRPREDGFDVGYSFDQAGLVVYGLVGNDVVAVDLDIASRTHRALLGENAYALRIEGAKREQLHSVSLHHRDGRVETIDVS